MIQTDMRTYFHRLQCVPLSGYGFNRGGYVCVCQPGYRLPMEQNGPFRGIDIEQATEQEYKDGFNCLPIGWREVVPTNIAKPRDTQIEQPIVPRSVIGR